MLRLPPAIVFPMILSVLTLSLLLLHGQGQGRTALYPEAKQIILTGNIKLLHGYGPPGWGEDPKHDEHISYWVIDLPKPLNTPCTPERSEWAATDCQPAKQLRLIVEADARLLAAAKAAKGRRAKVTGTLHRQDTAGEMTSIFMEVTEIKLLQ